MNARLNVPGNVILPPPLSALCPLVSPVRAFQQSSVINEANCSIWSSLASCACSTTCLNPSLAFPILNCFGVEGRDGTTMDPGGGVGGGGGAILV